MTDGCANAIFTLRTSIDFFRERGSTLYAASLDISKAFATVSHHKMFDSLLKTGFPVCLLSSLMNCYCKLNVAVRWKVFLSCKFFVPSGVRQSSSLSPSIFNVFINVFIAKVRTLRHGCRVCGQFVGCILYADDIIIIIIRFCQWTAEYVRLLF